MTRCEWGAKKSFQMHITSSMREACCHVEREQVKDTDLWEIMQLLQVDFGERLQNGLDTRVGRHGMKLSGGQAQRLMIAAAVIKQPSFMVIDEATSSLDSITEREVQHGLKVVLTRNVGALIVAHRLSTVRYLCDRFILVRNLDAFSSEENQIEAIGSSFEELYATSPTFRSLSDAQEIVISEHP